MCIDLPGNKVQNGNTLWIWGCNGADSQKWTYDQVTSTIRYTGNQNFCIDVPGGNTQNGNHLQLWQCNGHQSQKWYIHKGRASRSDSLMLQVMATTHHHVEVEERLAACR